MADEKRPTYTAPGEIISKGTAKSAPSEKGGEAKGDGHRFNSEIKYREDKAAEFAKEAETSRAEAAEKLAKRSDFDKLVDRVTSVDKDEVIRKAGEFSDNMKKAYDQYAKKWRDSKTEDLKTDPIGAAKRYLSSDRKNPEPGAAKGSPSMEQERMRNPAEDETPPTEKEASNRLPPTNNKSSGRTR